MKAINLKTEHMVNPIGVDFEKPYLSWICKDGITQSAFEVEAITNDVVIWSSGKIKSNTMNTILDTDLESRQIVNWRVRLWDENEKVGDWSEFATFEMGLKNNSEFVAKWINPELECDPMVHKPASYLKTTFNIENVEGKARLYVTAHGLYEVFINGNRVGDFVLAPGTSSYAQKLTYQTYDVTNVLKTGNNDVLVILGDGWYRSCSGVDGDRNLYGEDIALFFQLEVEGVPICLSNENWVASQDGPIRQNDMQQGEVFDARMEEVKNWHKIKVENFSFDNIVACDTVHIVEAEHFDGKIIKTPNGELVIDYGQNLAGYIEFMVTAKEGDEIVLTHGETLDENGNFTIENFQDRKRHKEGGIAQKVIYTCKEGLNYYKTKFTIWGFRYAKIETSVNLTDAKFTSIAVYSKMDKTGWFECSNIYVNKLVENSVWSMKSNFCDVPTDCPTRERAGWTGDMGVFVETALYLESAYPVISKWLSECRLVQYADGKVANIAPKNNLPTQFSEMLSGSVGWGDASIIVPYEMYKRNQNVKILYDNYSMMEKWYGFLMERAKQNGEQSNVETNPYAEYTIDTGVDYGEWCEPDSNPMMAMAKPQYKVSTAYYAYSGRLLSEIAEILGKKEDAEMYRDISEKATKAFYHIATENGKIVSEHQAEYVRAISFSLLSKEDEKIAVEDLNDLIIKNGYCLNTGFLSTPTICTVLADNGYLDTAYKLLLQDSMPSWLYAVKKGATTIWETWDGINEKGEVKESLNHYSYGAICGWLFGGICGIKVKNGQVKIKPQPNKQLEYAKAVYNSPLGEIKSAWKYEGEKVTFEISIPANVVAEVVLPNGNTVELSTGNHILS